MAATVGRLVIDLAANVAQLRTDMSSAAQVVESVGGQISKAADYAKTALMGMAAAIGPAAFAEMIGSTIKATAELDNMAEKVGLSVEALSAIRAIAQVVGGDMNTIAQGVAKLDKAMYEAATSGGKIKEVFQLIGVEFRNADGTLRNVDDTLLDVAKAFSQMEGGAAKTAIAQALLGKSGKELIEVLNELGKAGEYQAKVTTEQAQRAQEFERDLVRVGASGREMRQILANEMTPALDALLKTWLGFINEGGGLRALFKEWAADGTFADWFRYAGLQVAKLADALVDFKNLFIAWGETIGSVLGLLKGVWDQLAGGAAILAGQWKEGLALIRQGTELNKESLYGLADAWGKNTEFSTKFQQAYVGNLIAIDTTTRAIQQQGPVLTDHTEKTQKAAKATDEWAAYFKLVWERVLEEEKALKAYNAEVARAIEHANRYVESLKETVAQSEFETSQLGLSSEQIRINTALREIDIRTRAMLNDLHRKGIDTMDDVIQKEAEEAKQSVTASVMKQKAYQDWYDLMQTAAGGVKNFILDFVENGSAAFKNLWQNFKRWALEALAEIAAKQIVVSIVGALGLGGSTVASAAGAVGLGSAGNGLSTLLGLGNSASSVAGGGSLLGGVAEGIGSTLFGNALSGGAFATGLTSPLGTITTLLGGSGGATIGAGLGLEAALGAAVPLVGLGLGIASLLGAFDSGGGPMTRNYGLAGGNLSTFSDLSSLHKLVGTDAVEQGTYDAIAQGMLDTYNALMEQLGVTTAAKAAFAVYTSQDPQGDSASTVDIRAMLNGQQVYVGNSGETIARTKEALDAAVQSQAQAAILAAVQSSGVTADTILNAFNAMTPAEQAQNQSLFAYLLNNTQAPVAIDNFNTAATQQTTAATTMQAAANTISAAATTIAAASATLGSAATTYDDATAGFMDAAALNALGTSQP